MSGRLVILPHKSWNVWNQDNREKVLRDERLQQETENKTLEEERQRIQEKNYENLVGSSSTTQGKVIIDEPFRLFADLEHQAAKSLAAGNPDYLKEKQDQEVKKRKREGVEDWALGDGSLEKRGIKPWYEKPINDSQQPRDLEKWKKDIVRKSIDDPMAHYMRQYVPDTYANESKEMIDLPPPTSLTSHQKSQIISPAVQQEESSYSSKKMKKEKKEKHKHSEEEKSHRLDADQQSLHVSSATKVLLGKFDVEELRKRRLEREEAERRRAMRLLAETDIYGSPGYSSQPTRNYSQQYNPNIARNNK